MLPTEYTKSNMIVNTIETMISLFSYPMSIIILTHFNMQMRKKEANNLSDVV
jgi:hypothetical protein